MRFFSACLLSKDGVIIADDVEVWIHHFRLGRAEVWDGSIEIPVTTPLTTRTYRIRLADGREGKITPIATRIYEENIMLYFSGDGPLQ